MARPRPCAGNHPAISKIATLPPVAANDAGFAAQCVAARAQAEDILRLSRQHAGHIGIVMRLNAQRASMEGTLLSVPGCLKRAQVVCRKREATDRAAAKHVWAAHVAERSMRRMADPDAEGLEAAQPNAALPTCRRPAWAKASRGTSHNMGQIPMAWLLRRG